MVESPVLKVLLAVVPLLSTTLYLMGLSYHEGLLSGFGLESSLFPISSDRALLQGFFILIIVGFEPIIYTFFILLLVFLLLVVAVLVALDSRFKKVKQKVSPYIPKKLISDEATNVIGNGATSISYIVAVFCIILLPFYISYLSVQTGINHAEETIKRFEKGTGSWAELYEKGASTPTSVSEILCSSQHCAFWNGNESVVLSHESITKTVVHKKSNHNEK